MKNLKTLRKNRGLTLMETAKQIGISQQMLSYYEMQGNPPIETIIKIANFFDCSVDYLLGHQTHDTLQLSGLSNTQKDLLAIITQLDDRACDKVESYALGLMEAELEKQKTIEKFKK